MARGNKALRTALVITVIVAGSTMAFQHNKMADIDEAQGRSTLFSGNKSWG